MTAFTTWLKRINVVLGVVSIAFLGFAFIVFSQLRPRMVAFEPLSPFEESLFDWLPLGLLALLVFYSLSLFGLARYLRKASKMSVPSILLGISGVLSFILVFSDGALLHDIFKQYGFELAQPEWSLLFPIMGLQFVTALGFTYFHLVADREGDQAVHVVRDSNIFIAVQYVGMICGLFGLALASLGFVFSHNWSLPIHSLMTSIILLLPYALAVGYWVFIKLREEERQWYDEKQLQDVGKSAFLTLVTGAAFLVILFATNYGNLDGIVSILWLPLYLFFILFFFSLGNIYFGAREG
jgi:hypothetical protein